MVEEHRADNVLVLLGCPDADSTEIFAMTVISGDPTFAGPLAGVALGLTVHHVIQEEVRASTPPDLFESEIGLLAAALDSDAIGAALERARTSA